MPRPQKLSLEDQVTCSTPQIKEKQRNYRGTIPIDRAVELPVIIFPNYIDAVQNVQTLSTRCIFFFFDQIFTLSRKLEHRQTFARPYRACLLDFRETSESVDRQSLRTILRIDAMPEKNTVLFETRYSLQLAGICVCGKKSMVSLGMYITNKIHNTK